MGVKGLRHSKVTPWNAMTVIAMNIINVNEVMVVMS